jgi:hypothetical protein
MSEEEQETSESGAPIYRYDEQEERGFRMPEGESALEEITDQVEKYFGPVTGVYHEIVSDLVHIDVLIVQPTEEHNFYTLVTSGMSDLPMTVPEGREEYRYAELFLMLPPDWPLGDKEVNQDNRYYWPIFWLKAIARFPHDYQTWIASGHTIPNGEEAAPLGDGTDLGCIMMIATATPHDDFGMLEVNDDKVINFYNLFPLYREEMDYKLKEGLETLADKMVEYDISEIIDPNRPNMCKKKRGLFGLW